ncbi:hypothetical protein [Rhodococcus rhodochrous]|uniref:hypothetical protein n=1 Tax=Rhodococcus rhodochrous TaxID=1829 RepID=UPI001E283DAF|nr:hypothetical protein [Rhodococcus rhodochrous]MCD2097070.1 hypothetical protein [Rhodococcus rhodochrous]MCD2120498.1 hypothetical protein [Rhodococcus rhodochrous]MCQ4137109.1 hypothetical protein [Rhodococcus rhodochrous]MDJ0017363.1 hypothetical protein [Rhodococcus rhodochrous]
MTAPCSPARPDRLGRLTAVLAGTTATTHLVTVAFHRTVSPTTLLLVAMAVACLTCCRHLWRAPSPATFATAAVTTTLMLALHIPLPHHDHTTAHAPADLSAAGSLDLLMTAATGLALVELAVTVTAVFVRTRAIPEAVLGRPADAAHP